MSAECGCGLLRMPVRDTGPGIVGKPFSQRQRAEGLRRHLPPA